MAKTLLEYKKHHLAEKVLNLLKPNKIDVVNEKAKMLIKKNLKKAKKYNEKEISDYYESKNKNIEIARIFLHKQISKDRDFKNYYDIYKRKIFAKLWFSGILLAANIIFLVLLIDSGTNNPPDPKPEKSGTFQNSQNFAASLAGLRGKYFLEVQPVNNSSFSVKRFEYSIDGSKGQILGKGTKVEIPSVLNEFKIKVLSIQCIKDNSVMSLNNNRYIDAADITASTFKKLSLFKSLDSAGKRKCLTKDFKGITEYGRNKYIEWAKKSGIENSSDTTTSFKSNLTGIEFSLSELKIKCVKSSKIRAVWHLFCYLISYYGN